MAAGVYLPIIPHSSSVYERGTINVKEAASQTFKKGAPVIINSSGFLEEAGTGPSLVWGIAAEDGRNGTEGQYSCPVFRVTAADLFIISAEDALAQTQLGDDYGLVKDATTGYWYVDSGDTGDQVSIDAFVETPSLGAIGDTKARVLCKFNSANVQNP